MIPKPPSRAAEVRAKRMAQKRIQQQVYRIVSARDGYRCRCCGQRDRLHHHHVKLRSAGGGDSADNLILLCGVCHADVHAYRLRIEIGPDGPVFSRIS